MNAPTRSVVTAPSSSMDLIAEIIRQLDERQAQEAEIRVITVVNGRRADVGRHVGFTLSAGRQPGRPAGAVGRGNER